MRDLGFIGHDVSYEPQNRYRAFYQGCPGDDCGNRGVALAALSPVPAGGYMAAVGKTVRMGGLGMIQSEPALPASPAMRGALVISGLRGMRLSGAQRIMLGDAASDRQTCSAVAGAFGGAAQLGQSMHTSSGGGDQGWTTALGIAQAGSQIAGAMCNMIGGTQVTPQASGSTLPPQYTPYQPPTYTPPPQAQAAGGVPSWAWIVGGIAVAGAALFVVLK
jgi:hypothetical protein